MSVNATMIEPLANSLFLSEGHVRKAAPTSCFEGEPVACSRGSNSLSRPHPGHRRSYVGGGETHIDDLEGLRDAARGVPSQRRCQW